jgi:hypothetical protein
MFPPCIVRALTSSLRTATKCPGGVSGIVAGFDGVVGAAADWISASRRSVSSTRMARTFPNTRIIEYQRQAFPSSPYREALVRVVHADGAHLTRRTPRSV